MTHEPTCAALRERVNCLTWALELCGHARETAPALETEEAVEYVLGHLDVAEAAAGTEAERREVSIRRGAVREYADDGDQTYDLCDCGALDAPEEER